MLKGNKCNITVDTNKKDLDGLRNESNGMSNTESV